MRIPRSNVVATPRVQIDEGLHTAVIIAAHLNPKGPSQFPYIALEVALTDIPDALPTVTTIVSLAPSAAFAYDQLCDACELDAMDQNLDTDDFEEKMVQVSTYQKEFPVGSGNHATEIQRFYPPNYKPAVAETTKKRSGILEKLAQDLGKKINLDPNGAADSDDDEDETPESVSPFVANKEPIA